MNEPERDELAGQKVDPLVGPPSETVSPVDRTEFGGVRSGCDAAPDEKPAVEGDTLRQEFLWNTHQYLGEYVRFADTKAAFAGTMAAALLGAMYSARAHIPVVSVDFLRWPMSSWLALGAGVLLMAAFALAIWTIVPRQASTQREGFVFWGNIAAHGTFERLQASFDGQSVRALNDHLLHHIFDISRVACIPKFRNAATSLWLVLVGGVLAAVAMLLQDAQRSIPNS